MDCTGAGPASACERAIPLCLCCGRCILDEMPGSFRIHPICLWEDDDFQFRWPTAAGGANQVSLVEAQRNYPNFDACDQHGRKYVRPPAEDELLALLAPHRPDARLFRGLGRRGSRPWPDDRSVLLRWLPAFWRRDHPGV
jgi:hypothetical protein